MVVGGVATAGALFLPWFNPAGNFLILFGALDRVGRVGEQLTGWEAFGWQDVAVVVLAAGLVACALTGRLRWAIPLAAAGAILSLTMLADVPAIDAPGAVAIKSTTTAGGWLAVVGFALAGTLSALRVK